MQPLLVAGRKFPRTYREFVEMFPDDQACATYLEQLRWPDGFVCPACRMTTIDMLLGFVTDTRDSFTHYEGFRSAPFAG